MWKRFRSLLFWIHLVAGVVAGLVIAVMSLTGALLAFEGSLVRWAERDGSTGVTAGAAMEVEAAARLAERVSGRRAQSVMVRRDVASAVEVEVGEGQRLFVDRRAATVRASRRAWVRAALDEVEAWHRSLGLMGARRALGKAITGAANVAFLVMGVTGIVLWVPRRWGWGAVRAVVWFRRGLKGKARDYNWHHAVGVWCVMVLVVVSATGVVISYRAASDAVYRAAGEVPRTAPLGGAPMTVTAPEPGLAMVPLDRMVARVASEAPRWSSITWRGSPTVRDVGPVTRARGQVFLVRAEDDAHSWVVQAVVVDPFSADVLRVERYETSTRGRKVRLWIRFLHTGQALGVGGQAVAMVAAVGALVLVWTGLALSWRRFFRRG